MDKITIELYTPTSIAVFGNTMAIKEHFKRIGGMYNANLKGTDGESKRKGWIFPKAKLQDVRGLLDDYRNDRVDTSYVHPPKSGASQSQSQPAQSARPVSAYAASSSKQRDDDAAEPEFIVTHKMYLSMISRLERLEAELTIAKKALAGTIQSTERPKAVKSKPPTPVQVVFDDDEEPEEEEEQEEEEEETIVPPQKEVKVVPEFEDIPEFQPKRLLGRKKQQPEINL